MDDDQSTENSPPRSAMDGDHGIDNSSPRSATEDENGNPEHFLCPISPEILIDPVVLSSGQTYNHGITMPQLDNSTLITVDERIKLKSLLLILKSSTFPEKKKAVKELGFLTTEKSFLALISQNPKAIWQILNVLCSWTLDADLQDDAITSILNISMDARNKKLIGRNSEAVSILIDTLTSGLKMQTRRNAAAALFSLAALDESNKIRIVRLGAMRPLAELLECGSISAKNDALCCIINLCTVPENSVVAVREGIVGVSLLMIQNGVLVSESLRVLRLLSPYKDAANELADKGGVYFLLRILRGTCCPRDKENAIGILYAIAVDHCRKVKEVRNDETLYGTLSKLQLAGTSRAKRKAAGLLFLLEKTAHDTIEED